MNNAQRPLSGWNLNLLVVFEALMAERNVGRAGKRLGLSQPAVSHALAQLRADLNDPLFVRTASGVEPTERALALVGPVQSALSIISIAVAPPTFEPAKANHTFTLAATDFAEFVLLPKLLAHLARVAPFVRLQLRAWPHHRVPPFLSTGEADVALGFFGDVPPAHNQLPLFEDRFVCAARKGHPLVKKRLTLPAYLKLKHILVTADPQARGVVDDELAKQGKSREIGLRLSHFLMVPAVVASTDLVAALSYRVAEPMAAILPLQLLPLPLHVPRGRVSLVWHDRFTKAPAHIWFRNQIKAVAAQV
ncbi:MAG: LysR family transcriptional regulator [Deltaproteobacteria bacterium]|nr:LysR family transcriptional regulator [Deltaproteobacteria bacterium]